MVQLILEIELVVAITAPIQIIVHLPVHNCVVKIRWAPVTVFGQAIVMVVEILA